MFAYMPDDPKVRPDLEIETSRDMGNGSREVCDRKRPNIGGIPGINPPNFGESKKISDAINDFSCRFETFIESDGSCTLKADGDYSFVSKDTTTQFCMIVARAYMYPVGRTLLSVRVRDTEGNPGPVKQMWIARPATRAKPAKPTPKPANKGTLVGWSWRIEATAECEMRADPIFRVSLVRIPTQQSVEVKVNECQPSDSRMCPPDQRL